MTEESPGDNGAPEPVADLPSLPTRIAQVFVRHHRLVLAVEPLTVGPHHLSGRPIDDEDGVFFDGAFGRDRLGEVVDGKDREAAVGFQDGELAVAAQQEDLAVGLGRISGRSPRAAPANQPSLCSSAARPGGSRTTPSTGSCPRRTTR